MAKPSNHEEATAAVTQALIWLRDNPDYAEDCLKDALKYLKRIKPKGKE